MKTVLAFVWITLASVFLSPLFAAGLDDATVSERGPFSRTWKRVSERTTPDGRVIPTTNSFVELGSGICFWKDGQWRDTKAEFQLLPGGAVAQEGPFQLIITPDIASEGSIEFVTPDAKRFVSSPRWLAYYEPATGRSTIIAAVKSCIGELVAPNVVVFADAFDDLKAALRYTYNPGGIEQEVIFLESGSLRPEDWGFNPGADVVLEMWSEFHTCLLYTSDAADE